MGAVSNFCTTEPYSFASIEFGLFEMFDKDTTAGNRGWDRELNPTRPNESEANWNYLVYCLIQALFCDEKKITR